LKTERTPPFPPLSPSPLSQSVALLCERKKSCRFRFFPRRPRCSERPPLFFPLSFPTHPFRFFRPHVMRDGVIRSPSGSAFLLIFFPLSIVHPDATDILMSNLAKSCRDPFLPAFSFPFPSLRRYRRWNPLPLNYVRVYLRQPNSSPSKLRCLPLTSPFFFLLHRTYQKCRCRIPG